jgi:hypothetical protein
VTAIETAQRKCTDAETNMGSFIEIYNLVVQE